MQIFYDTKNILDLRIKVQTNTQYTHRQKQRHTYTRVMNLVSSEVKRTPQSEISII